MAAGNTDNVTLAVAAAAIATAIGKLGQLAISSLPIGSPASFLRINQHVISILAQQAQRRNCSSV
jgi:hypothetical protein